MKKLNSRTSALLLLGCCAAFATRADERQATDVSCRQETKRIAVWPVGPKATVVRFEQREVRVCDTKGSQQLAKGK
jgi:hypothetical protein